MRRIPVLALVLVLALAAGLARSRAGSAQGAGPITVTSSAVESQFPQGALFKLDRKSTRLNSSHNSESRMPSSA
jgi:hypothetical protein